MPMPLVVRAPAKLNLYLRVIGRRPDGYHEIETLFERIFLADELAFEPAAAGVHLTCDDPRLSCGDDNLILKAAALLRQATGTRLGASIHLTKRIPIAAGLGGGSSDAAAALRGLSQLWRLGIAADRLQEWGAQLGSDVPFFLQPSRFAIGRGRGERCEPVDGPRLAHVLVVPNAALPTKEIYEAFDQTPVWSSAGPSRLPAHPPGGQAELNLTASAPSISMVAHAFSNGSLSELAKGLWNDLEPIAIRRCPVIEDIQLALHASGCLGVRLSGSGPSVYGLCTDLAQARIVAARVTVALRAQDRRRRGQGSQRVEVVETDSANAS